MRLAFAAVVFVVVGLPVAAPVAACLTAPPRDPGRVAGLTLTTAALAAVAVAVAAPPGVVLGVRLGRGGRLAGGGWVAVAAGAAVPLPVAAVAWQVLLGGLVELVAVPPGEPTPWRPWREGLLPAGLVHGLAGVPAVAAAVALAVRTADRHLLEAALMDGGWLAAARRVLLLRALLGAAAGAGWVAVQAATEIPVTDAMLVRTAAEEVYTQFATDAGGLRAAVALALPAWLLSAGVAWLVAESVAARAGRSGGGALPDRSTGAPGWADTGLTLAAAAVLVAAVGLPVGAITWKAAGGGSGGGASPRALAGAVAKAARTDGETLAGSLGASLAAGAVAAGCAAGAAWQARLSRRAARGWGLFAVAVAVTPGPVVGVGLQLVIGALMDAEDWLFALAGLAPTFPPARSLLYSQPSPVPAAWAAAVRFFPVAFAVLLPAARLIPAGLIDRARLDGLGPAGTLRRVAWPHLGAAFAAATVAAAALALGEISASRLVDPPGRGAYVLRLFGQMHYGAESTVAAMALLQIAAVTLLVATARFGAPAPSPPEAEGEGAGVRGGPPR